MRIGEDQKKKKPDAEEAFFADTMEEERKIRSLSDLNREKGIFTNAFADGLNRDEGIFNKTAIFKVKRGKEYE